MALKYDIDSIFKDLEFKIRKDLEEKKIKEQKENEKEDNEPKEKKEQEEQEAKKGIEAPDDQPETDEVAPATSKQSEDIHGGDEASKQIKDSPNSAKDGEEQKNTEQEEGKEDSKEERQSESENKSDDKKDTKKLTKNKNGGGDKDAPPSDPGVKTEREDIDKKDNPEMKDKISNQDNKNTIDIEKIKEKLQKKEESKKNLENEIKKFFEDKEKKLEDYASNNRFEYLQKTILEIIKELALKHAGMDKMYGSEMYDKKAIVNHLIKNQSFLIPSDRCDYKDARYVQFFIDTSGVYGCGSNREIQELMPKIINILESQGYECHLAACGNGFYDEDLVDDEAYGTRQTLLNYKAGIVDKYACPSIKTAAKLANEAEFTFILADFDGLSSICEMASLCQPDKVPYFLSTEDRYSWDAPTEHDWVDPDWCWYDKNLIYDVSYMGNPTYDEYLANVEESQEEYYENNDYDNDDYDNDNYDNDDYDNDDYDNDYENNEYDD